MELEKALSIVTALSDGKDPKTGETYPPESPYQDPETVRALYVAKDTLAFRMRRQKQQGDRPANMGKPWSRDEEAALLQQFDAGTSIRDISVAHKRTEVAIRARLEKLGKLTKQPVGTGESF